MNRDTRTFHSNTLLRPTISVCTLLMVIIVAAGVAAAAMPPVPYFSQCDSRWGSDKLGGDGPTICSQGCALTSAAMVMAYYGVDTDPKRLNDAIGRGGYDATYCIYWSAVRNTCHDEINQIKYDPGKIKPFDETVLNTHLDLGRPVIVYVYCPGHGGYWGDHFVVVTGRSDGTYYINDPGFKTISTLDAYPTRHSMHIYSGNPPDINKPLVGDWNGNGTDTTGIYNYTTANFSLDSGLNISFGISGDIPITGDWNGNGYDTIGVFRPSSAQFFLDYDNDGVSDINATFGVIGDIPVVGDWDGDGDDNIGVFRPNHSDTGLTMFFLDLDNSGGSADQSVAFGEPDDLPVIGDWDGDGDDDIGLYRPGSTTGVFYLDIDNDGGSADIVTPEYGDLGDVPIAGDWDGDGDDNIGVYRPGTGEFFVDAGVPDVLRPTLLWKYQTGGGVKNIAAGDINGDNLADVIAGTAYPSYDLVAIDSNGTLLWNYSIVEKDKVNSWTVAIGDIDGDGENDVVAGKEYYGKTSWMDIPNVFAIKSNGSLLWTYTTEGWIDHIIVGDINEDGENEIITGGANHEMLYCLKSDGTLLWNFSLPYGGAFRNKHALSLGDVDGDGLGDVVVGTGTYAAWSPPSGNSVVVIKSDGTLLWKEQMLGGVWSIDVGDVDGNGQNEVMVGDGHGLYAFNSNGTLLWSYYLISGVNDISLGDLDGDEVKEIVAGSDDNIVYILNGNGTLLWKYQTDSWWLREVEIEDITGDKTNEVILGGCDCKIYAIRNNGTLLWKYQTGGCGLVTGDINGDGTSDVITSQDHYVYALTTAPETIQQPCGDLNGDGILSPADAAIALHLAATGAHNPAADMSGDGKVTSLDALMILQAAADSTTRKENQSAVIETSMGTMTVELYGQRAPNTTANFIELAESGFYDGLIFHRVIDDFVIQGGCPNGDGTGGSGKAIELEIHPDLTHVDGAIAMARSQDPDSASSQFYICDGAQHMLNGQYAVFGRVIDGINVVRAIAEVATDSRDKPIEDVVIIKISIIDRE